MAKQPSYSGKMIKMIFNTAPGWAVLNVIFSVLKGIVPLAILIMVKLLIDDISTGAGESVQGEKAFTILIIIGLAIILNILSAFISTIASERQSIAVTAAMFDILHRKTTSLNLSYFENPQYHDILFRASREASFRPGMIISNLIQLMQSGVSFVFVTLILFTFHWSFIIVLIVAAVPIFLVRIKLSSKVHKWRKGKSSDERMISYLNRLVTEPVFAKELRIFNLKEHFKNRFAKAKKTYDNESFNIMKKHSLIELLVQLFSTTIVFAYMFLIAKQTVDGLITVGAMVMYLLAIQRGFTYMQQLVRSLAGVHENNLFMHDFNELSELEQNIDNLEFSVHMPGILQEGIKIEGLCFKYPGNRKNVLEDISLIIPKGTSVAFVGDNGAGKTTLAKLLCKLYLPDQGSILFDDTDYKHIKAADLSREISVIFQDYVLYNLTAKENINLGDLDKDDNDRIYEAAKRAGIDDVLKHLPDGYETVLGKLFNNSEELSIGEWQKLALARAFYRDSQVIILDEPTSSLDARSESEIIDKFLELTRDKTAIIISHRFSTVRKVDKIFVLENGRIVETGNHDELMRKNGKYASLYKIQSGLYYE